jgi:hypothetical protein
LALLAQAQWGYKHPSQAAVEQKINNGIAYPYGPQRYWPGFEAGQKYQKKQEPMPSKKRVE